MAPSQGPAGEKRAVPWDKAFMQAFFLSVFPLLAVPWDKAFFYAGPFCRHMIVVGLCLEIRLLY